MIAPDWAVCEIFGCSGTQVRRQMCLAHVTDDDRADYFSQLAPGSAVNHSGTRFTPALLGRLLNSLDRRVGDARFDGAKFSGAADFARVRFEGDASFYMAEFSEDVNLSGALFEDSSRIGPLYCRTVVNLKEAIFRIPVTLDIAARWVQCTRTHWESTANMRLRYAVLDLEGAVLDQPVAISAALLPFVGDGESEAAKIFGSDPVPDFPKVVSIGGVDAAQIVLTDLDLAECRFSGAFHLDQVVIGGDTRFSMAPQGARWRPGVSNRWTRRKVVAEEHYWRAESDEMRGARSLWRLNPTDLNVANPGPRQVAAIYRQLRKSLEDGKNEPDAADFYYGEMEMRRRDITRPRAERVLLATYWGVSGYGLRASRALGWLLLAMVSSIFAVMLWGLPQDAPKSTAIGTSHRGLVKLTIDTADPIAPTVSLGDRLSAGRLDGSLQVVLNSVIFRSSSQQLTTVGTYIEMVSRIFEPALLGLGILAIRGRIKR